MTVELEIQDGALPNWWLSPNIWTTFANDPSLPAQPIKGSLYYVWAKVRNNGSSPVDRAEVLFYWANPSVGFNRITATRIDDPISPSYVSLAAHDVKVVQCTKQWDPTYAGHVCLLAEIFHSRDPIPATVDFHVPTDRHVAQRNINVLKVLASKRMKFSFNFSVCNSSDKEQKFRIYSKSGKLEELKPLKNHFSPIKIPFQAKGTIEHAGFVASHDPDQRTTMVAKPMAAKSIIESIPVKGNACRGLSSVGQLHGDAALMHILQEVDGKIIGGLSVLILSEKAYQS